MNSLFRGLAAGWALAFLPVSVPAITNVPPGVLVWLQGYDLNPTSPAFRNEGIVKLETIDDALPVGLRIDGTGLENAPGGLILFAPGAGGSRSLAGRLLNLGRVQINYGTAFLGPLTRVENEAEFVVDITSVAVVLGPDATFVQRSGSLACGYGFTVQDGTLEYEGGRIDGEPQLVRSVLRVAPGIAEPFAAALLGESRYDGRLQPGQSLRLAGSTEHGPAKVRLNPGATVAGQLTLTSTNGPGLALLQVAEGITIAPGGRLIAEAGAGGPREIEGSLELLGELHTEVPLLFTSASALTNRGTISIRDLGQLTVNGAFVQESGRLELEGGGMSALECLKLRGGTLTGHGHLGTTLTNAALVDLRLGKIGLEITGNYGQSAQGRLQIALSSSLPAQAVPALSVSGEVRLDGIVAVTLPEGDVPAAGTRFPLIKARDFHGRLERFEVPALPPNRYWDLAIDAGTLWATVRIAGERPALGIEQGPDGTPRLRAFDGPPLAIAVEYSTDLTVWTPIQVRIEFANGAVCLGDLPTDSSLGAVFFRGYLRE